MRTQIETPSSHHLYDVYAVHELYGLNPFPDTDSSVEEQGRSNHRIQTGKEAKDFCDPCHTHPRSTCGANV